MIGNIASAFFGISGGVVTGGAVAAIFGILNIMPRLYKDCSEAIKMNYLVIALCLGTIFGTLISLYDIVTDLGILFVCFFGLFIGIFVGVLIISISEVFDIITLISGKHKTKLFLRSVAITIALSKLSGSLIFWILPRLFK